jgi:hypothetical protein
VSVRKALERRRDREREEKAARLRAKDVEEVQAAQVARERAEREAREEECAKEAGRFAIEALDFLRDTKEERRRREQILLDLARGAIGEVVAATGQASAAEEHTQAIAEASTAAEGARMAAEEASQAADEAVSKAMAMGRLGGTPRRMPPGLGPSTPASSQAPAAPGDSRTAAQMRAHEDRLAAADRQVLEAQELGF